MPDIHGCIVDIMFMKEPGKNIIVHCQNALFLGCFFFLDHLELMVMLKNC